MKMVQKWVCLLVVAGQQKEITVREVSHVPNRGLKSDAIIVKKKGT